MSNVEVAKVLMVAMYHLTCVAIWQIRGNLDKADRSEREFRKLYDSLSEIDGCEVEHEPIVDWRRVE